MTTRSKTRTAVSSTRPNGKTSGKKHASDSKVSQTDPVAKRRRFGRFAVTPKTPDGTATSETVDDKTVAAEPEPSASASASASATASASSSAPSVVHTDEKHKQGNSALIGVHKEVADLVADVGSGKVDIGYALVHWIRIGIESEEGRSALAAHSVVYRCIAAMHRVDLHKALWQCVGLASRADNTCAALLDAGTFEAAKTLLSSPKTESDIVTRIFRVLGNMTNPEESVTDRQRLKAKGIVDLLRATATLGARTPEAAWFFGYACTNLIESKEFSDDVEKLIDIVCVVVPIAGKWLASEYEDAKQMKHLLEFITDLCKTDRRTILHAVMTDCKLGIISALRHPSAEVVTLALRALGHLSFRDEHEMELVRCGVMEGLVDLVDHKDSAIRQTAWLSIANCMNAAVREGVVPQRLAQKSIDRLHVYAGYDVVRTLAYLTCTPHASSVLTLDVFRTICKASTQYGGLSADIVRFIDAFVGHNKIARMRYKDVQAIVDRVVMLFEDELPSKMVTVAMIVDAATKLPDGTAIESSSDSDGDIETSDQ